LPQKTERVGRTLQKTLSEATALRNREPQETGRQIVEKNSWGNPPKNLFRSIIHLLQRIAGKWETNVEQNSWGNPHKNLFCGSTSHLPKLEDLSREEQLGELSKEPLLKHQPFAPKDPEDKHVSLPQGLWWRPQS